MKKIIYGWLVFLTLPLTVLGYSEVVLRVNPSTFTQVILGAFCSGVVIFQFIMTASLIVSGWETLGLKNPFK